MNDATSIIGLVGTGTTRAYSAINTSLYNHNGNSGNGAVDEDEPQQQQQRLQLRRWKWKIIGLASIALLVGFILGQTIPNQIRPLLEKWNIRQQTADLVYTKTCRFCDQSPPKLHRDKSFTIRIQSPGDENNNESATTAVVTPVTISYDYELYDGENLFTEFRYEKIPNLEFDYAILGVTSARNLHRDTGEDVSLDEVYVHHFTLNPTNMLGAETLARDESDPYMKLPEGYGLHVLAKEYPSLGANAHLLSNKNLAPVEGSLERAHKECNECYYAPGKGSDCTPGVSGTFACCGDSAACTSGGEDCACATNAADKGTVTKYRMELDLLISRDVDKFRRVDQWNFAAPSCFINRKGDAILEDYPSDDFCAKTNSTAHGVRPSIALYFGGGSLFHQIIENDEEPYRRTFANVLAPSGGRMVWAQSHLHTGGVNATLYKNGEILCTTEATYGTDPDPSSNSRNEENHLVRIDSCYDWIGKDGIRFEAGDVLTTESYYYGGRDDDRFSSEEAAGEHRNVMSMFFTGVVLDGDSAFLVEERTSFNLWNDFIDVAGFSS